VEKTKRGRSIQVKKMKAEKKTKKIYNLRIRVLFIIGVRMIKTEKQSIRIETFVMHVFQSKQQVAL
jgi:hypothetical protein